MVNDVTQHDDETLLKVYRVMEKRGLDQTEATDLVSELQNEGILFRERFERDNELNPIGVRLGQMPQNSYIHYPPPEDDEGNFFKGLFVGIIIMAILTAVAIMVAEAF